MKRELPLCRGPGNAIRKTSQLQNIIQVMHSALPSTRMGSSLHCATGDINVGMYSRSGELHASIHGQIEGRAAFSQIWCLCPAISQRLCRYRCLSQCQTAPQSLLPHIGTPSPEYPLPSGQPDSPRTPSRTTDKKSREEKPKQFISKSISYTLLRPIYTIPSLRSATHLRWLPGEWVRGYPLSKSMASSFTIQNGNLHPPLPPLLSLTGHVADV